MIRVLALDIDGVLTDGKVTLDDTGREFKTISYRDIDAIYLAHRRGLHVVLVTGEASPWVDTIARRLQIGHVCRGAKDKCEALRGLCGEMSVNLDQVCYVGDSHRDAEALSVVGLGLVPADASAAARRAAHQVLEHGGGDGAVAEAVEIVLRRWATAGNAQPAG